MTAFARTDRTPSGPAPRARSAQRACLAAHELHLPRPEHLLHADDEPLHRGVLAGDRLREIEGGALYRDPVRCGVVSEAVVGVARVEERLRRAAAHVHAGPAHPVALDERDARAPRAGVERRDVAAGPAAQDRDVERRVTHVNHPPAVR